MKRCTGCGHETNPEDLIDGLCDPCVDYLIAGPVGSAFDAIGRYKQGKPTRRSVNSTVRDMKTRPLED